MTTKRRKIAGFTVLAILAITVFAACGPTPAPGPAASCDNPASHDSALEAQMQTAYPYTVASDAQYGAQVSANRFCGAACPNPLPHQALASGWGEILFCQYYGTTDCPSPTLFAQDAVNGWLRSGPHAALMQQFAGHAMGAGYACSQGHAFGAIQFHQ